MASANSPGFQSMFEEVVHAKRLSNSKITKLCEIAMKNMENDSQMVSIMFRTHRSLSASGKVSSLYAIDALARNAKGAIEKKKVIADPNSPTGNCATFLLKLEGVLESIIQDMISTGTPEAKEKTKKILDIWTRHQTFSQSVMSRLAGITTEASGQETKSAQSTTPISDPRKTSTTPPNVNAPAQNENQPAAAVPPALLALLTQASASGGASLLPVNNVTTPTTNASPTVQLDPAQIALLQQLAATAKLAQGDASGVPGASAYSQPRPRTSQNDYAIAGPSVPVPTQPRAGSGEQYDQRRFDHHGRHREDSYRDREPRDDRPPWRGRGRGSYDHRGGYGRDRWDGPPRARRSRSRSPSSNHSVPRHRDVPPYSPPQRQASIPQEASGVAKFGLAHSEPTKDEFGRDIRSLSPSSDHGQGRKNPSVEASDPRIKPAQPPTAPPSQPQTQPPPVAPQAIATARSPPTGPRATSVTSQITTPIQTTGAPIPSVLEQGLDQFDLTRFDFSSAQSWQALGKAWLTTYGRNPTQEELMTYVLAQMSGGAGGAAGGMNGGAAVAQAGGGGGWDSSGDQPYGTYNSGFRGRGRGRGGFGRGRGRGRGGGQGYMGGGDENGHWGYGEGGMGGGHGGGGGGGAYDTDAVVLGGGGDTDDSYPSQGYNQQNQYSNNGYQGMNEDYGAQMNQYSGDMNSYGVGQGQEPPSSSNGGDGSEGGGGGGGRARMVKVGDGWVLQKS